MNYMGAMAHLLPQVWPRYPFINVQWRCSVQYENRLFLSKMKSIPYSLLIFPQNTNSLKNTAVNPDSSFREFVTDKVQTHQMQQLTCMELGDIIHVRGRLNRYRNRVEVSASYFSKCNSWQFNILQILSQVTSHYFLILEIIISIKPYLGLVTSNGEMLMV